MSYPKTVVDDIGNQYPRKNLLLTRDADEVAIQAYKERIQEARTAEKAFLAQKAERKSTFLQSVDDPDRSIRHWLAAANESEALAAFYQPLVDLDYDFELDYRQNLEIADQLPEIAAGRRQMLDLRDQTKKALIEAKKTGQKEEVAEFRRLRKERLAQLDQENKELKAAYKKRMISAKAFSNEKREDALAARDQIRVLRRQLPVNAEKERLRYARHRLRQDRKSHLRVLNSDLSDLRRKTPVETTRRKPLISYLTWPLPGLGQLVVGQGIKALFFFIGSLFLYLVAIPYALGRGNYRGKGLFGLVSLAQDGSRLDRSVIFMVEGVIAIILLVMGLLLLYQSFRDVRRVEKQMIRGIRRANWFETRTSVRRNGFPFFASAPAALVTLFIVLLPIAVTILISFTNYDPSHQSKFSWAGLANYKQIVLGQGIAGGPFWHITGWTVIWTLFATSLAILIGFVLALLVNQDRIYGKRLFRTVYLLPWAVPAFITIMFFSIMFSPDGPLTSVLSSLTGQITNIKYSTWGTRIVLILLQGWLGSSYVFLLCTGILQGIPKDLYEAARIDGATGFQATRHITIPILLFQTAPLMIGQYTFNFNNFSIIYLFNGGGPFEPTKYGNIAGSSDLLISYIYKLTIQKQYQGIGSAITLIVSLVLIFIAWVGFSRSKAFREERL
ncbi:MAG: ABC transporter permease subunit [Clostridiaceae bacterium]|nr:ABC transporter permease subunit [Clostridiaceae bacterium]